MAHQIRAINWILQHGEALSIHKQTWIEEVLPGWTDIDCELQLNGEFFRGSGAGPSDDLALCKGFAEALERGAVVASAKKSSNGFAAHLDSVLAKQLAIAELKERDLFLCHFLTKTPFIRIDPWQEDRKIADSIGAWKAKQEVEVQFFSLSKEGVFCAISGFSAKSPFGMTGGTAIRSNLKDAAISAFIEAARTATHFQNAEGSITPISVQTFLEKSKHSFGDHGLLALNKEYAAGFLNQFCPSKSELDLPRQQAHNSLRDDEIEAMTIDWQPLQTPDCPFQFAHAASTSAQDLWLGPTKPEFINLRRLCEFTGRDLSLNELNWAPHPFD